jgi:DNA-binding NarL/FixJ family response regulator
MKREWHAVEKLSKNERAVFHLLGWGKSTLQIAKIMNVKRKTINTYHARIKKKLGIANWHQLLYAAIRWQSGN